jgi:hypothetical protein
MHTIDDLFFGAGEFQWSLAYFKQMTFTTYIFVPTPASRAFLSRFTNLYWL